MSLRMEIDAALNTCRLQLQANKLQYSRDSYAQIKTGIMLLRRHLAQAYTSYKGMAYPEIKQKLIIDANRYYGECVGDYLNKTLPALVGKEGAIVDRMW